jgi:hypothetical protein
MHIIEHISYNMSNQCSRCKKRFSSSRGLSYHEKRSKCVYEYLERTVVSTTPKSVPDQPSDHPNHPPSDDQKHPCSNITFDTDHDQHAVDYPMWDDCSVEEDPVAKVAANTCAGNRASARLAMNRTIEFELMCLPDEKEGDQVDQGWKAISYPIHLINMDLLTDLVASCIILHNMGVSD